ncbi:hypothetical protein AVEN_268629-1 [Araneus ventricosus]|uniref:Uncharacterized protein n=1 Tax=Araneus ventricosus TaxID=182803 RepID=A0A4Y2KZ14_ARAVE|nr:hypothetical protein AVEN_268629-1 [Araneus ventricosus]
MRSRRISKRVLASLVGIVMGDLDPPPVVLRSTSIAAAVIQRIQMLSIQAVTAIVVQVTRKLRQGGLIQIIHITLATPLPEGHHEYVDEKPPYKLAGSSSSSGFFWGYSNGGEWGLSYPSPMTIRISFRVACDGH